MFFSVIIPLYNRPDEIRELLDSLVRQTEKNFEVIIVEDGSSICSEAIVEEFSTRLNITYYFKENTGPGTTRNYGAERAKGDYLVFFDSDCILDPDYFSAMEKSLLESKADAYGGPDRAHASFTNIQKAINYAMTSFFTTGGIRGGKKKMDVFYPRSFNMGISKKVFQELNGFADMRFGEDVDFSIRIIKTGYKTCLIPEAYVYHKRRTDFWQFYKQVHNSGIARINLHLLHPGTLKLVHMLPSAFFLGCCVLLLLSVLSPLFLLPIAAFILIVWVDSLIKNKNLMVAFASIVASFVQLFSYGLGFLRAFWKRILKQEGEFKAFTKNFYK